MDLVVIFGVLFAVFTANTFILAGILYCSLCGVKSPGAMNRTSILAFLYVNFLSSQIKVKLILLEEDLLAEV